MQTTNNCSYVLIKHITFSFKKLGKEGYWKFELLNSLQWQNTQCSHKMHFSCASALFFPLFLNVNTLCERVWPYASSSRLLKRWEIKRLDDAERIVTFYEHRSERFQFIHIKKLSVNAHAVHYGIESSTQKASRASERPFLDCVNVEQEMPANNQALWEGGKTRF